MNAQTSGWMQELRETTVQDARALGLTENEFHIISNLLKRNPNYVELGVFSAMWSEHCSYKTSKSFLRKLPTSGSSVAVGPGENAGAVHLPQGYVAVFKMESHNHPSFIEPFQGAATGVGGIMRDIFTMGARPVANADVLFFGKYGENPTPYLLDGVVSGISFYGNCMGVPTVTGQTTFDEAYHRNILVNAMTVGIAKGDGLFFGRAAGEGNIIIAFGNTTGPDGVHGAAMASQSFQSHQEKARPTVQVGDPFKEKILLEATLELMKSGFVLGIQDMGAAGLVSSTVEMADRAQSGVELNLSALPVRATGLTLVTPFQRLLSESQERMVMVLEPRYEEKALEILRKWELAGAVIGRVTTTHRWVCTFEGETVCSLPVSAVTAQAPPRSEARRAKQVSVSTSFPKLQTWTREIQRELDLLLTDTNFISRRPLFERYDHMVGLRTVQGPGAGVASLVFHADEGPTDGRLTISAGVKPHWVELNPKRGAAWNLLLHVQKHAASGSRALGLTDCLNYGSPEDPEVLWSFEQSLQGLSEASRELDVPVVSGNVSFYNQTDGHPILPTPSLGVVGWSTLQEVFPLPTFTGSQQFVYWIRARQRPSLAASLWARRNQWTEEIPEVDWKSEKILLATISKWINKKILSSCRVVGEGGVLGTSLAMCMSDESFSVGCKVGLRLESDWIEGLPDARAQVESLLGEVGAGFLVASPIEVPQWKDAPIPTEIVITKIGQTTSNPCWVCKEVSIDLESASKSFLGGLRVS